MPEGRVVVLVLFPIQLGYYTNKRRHYLFQDTTYYFKTLPISVVVVIDNIHNTTNKQKRYLKYDCL